MKRFWFLISLFVMLSGAKHLSAQYNISLPMARCDAGSQPGVDAAAKITACFTALGSTGGVADARGLTGTQTFGSLVHIPNNVKLLLGAATYNANVLPAITMGHSSSLIGVGVAFDPFSFFPATTIDARNATGTASVIQGDDPTTGNNAGLRIEDLGIRGPATAFAGIDFLGVAESEIKSVTVRGPQYGLHVGGNSICACYDRIYDFDVFGPALAGIWMDTTANKNEFYSPRVELNPGTIGYLMGGIGNTFYSPDMEVFNAIQGSIAASGAVRTSNVVTITTTAAMSNAVPTVGETAAITGMTDTSFNGLFAICGPPTTGCATPTSTSFTYQQTAANATSGSGSVAIGGIGFDYTAAAGAAVIRPYVELGYTAFRFRAGTRQNLLTDIINGGTISTTLDTSLLASADLNNNIIGPFSDWGGTGGGSGGAVSWTAAQFFLARGNSPSTRDFQIVNLGPGLGIAVQQGPDNTTPGGPASLTANSINFPNANTGVGGTGLTMIETSAQPLNCGVVTCTSLDQLWPDSTTHRWKVNPNSAGADTIVTAASTDTLTNKTLTSPVVNGTPTGTGIPTITQKIGSNAGNYSVTGTTFANVDATNLSYTVTIPTGWKLLCTAFASVGSSVAGGGARVQIFDTTTGLVVGTGASVNVTSTTNFPGYVGVTGVIAGNGAAHTINLQFAADAAATVTTMQNNSGFDPIMTFVLTPSN